MTMPNDEIEEQEELDIVEEQPDLVNQMLESPQDAGDDLSDIFEVTEEDVMGGDNEDLSDLVDVSNEDVMGSEDGDISDLVDVSNEDVMGTSPRKKQYRATLKGRNYVKRENPPPSLGGMR